MNNFVIVNLEKHYNHKLIGDRTIIDNSSNFDNDNKGITNSFLDPSLLPKSNEIITIDSIPFLFPDKSNKKFDNITCEEQKIYYQKGRYKQIHYLGLSGFYHFEENLKVSFLDEIFEKCTMYLMRWNESIGYKYEIKDNNTCVSVLSSTIDHDRSMNIFYNKCPIKNKDKETKNMILPYNPDMHILSITLEMI